MAPQRKPSFIYRDSERHTESSCGCLSLLLGAVDNSHIRKVACKLACKQVSFLMDAADHTKQQGQPSRGDNRPYLAFGRLRSASSFSGTSMSCATSTAHGLMST
jgi:hypothetical protein